MPERSRPQRRRHLAPARGPLLLGLGAVLAVTAPTVPVLDQRLAAGNGGGAGDSGNGKNNGIGNDGKNFLVAGSVTGLRPDGTQALVLTLTNQNNFPIRVASLSVAVGSSGGCAGSYLQVSPYVAGSVVIPGNGVTTTSLNVHMAGNAPNACKTRTFGLTYSGSAVKA